MQSLRSGFVLAATLALITAGGAGESVASTAPDPLDRPSEIMPLASASLLLDLVRAGDHTIAVGERGHILLSSNGTDWSQVADVPLRSTLTAVTAIGEQVWAVGHDGVILHSSDAGAHWQVQRRDPWQAPADDAVDVDIRQGVPLLDVLFTDADHGVAIGAYSLLLNTTDGGKTWAAVDIHASAHLGEGGQEHAQDNPVEDEHADAADAPQQAADDTFSADELLIGQEAEPHLNAIARSGDSWVIVGERGAVFRSGDGITWQRSQLPYDGSMFGVLGFEDGRVLAFGLRGHVFESTDQGATWNQVPTETQLSLMGASALSDGGAVIVGANGVLLRRAGHSGTFETFVVPSAGVIAGVLPAQDSGDLLIAGENGVRRYDPK